MTPTAITKTATTPTSLTARIQELVSACFTGIWLETCEPEGTVSAETTGRNSPNRMLNRATNQILLEFGFGEKDIDVDSTFGKMELQFHHWHIGDRIDPALLVLIGYRESGCLSGCVQSGQAVTIEDDREVDVICGPREGVDPHGPSPHDRVRNAESIE